MQKSIQASVIPLPKMLGVMYVPIYIVPAFRPDFPDTWLFLTRMQLRCSISSTPLFAISISLFLLDYAITKNRGHQAPKPGFSVRKPGTNLELASQLIALSNELISTWVKVSKFQSFGHQRTQRRTMRTNQMNAVERPQMHNSQNCTFMQQILYSCPVQFKGQFFYSVYVHSTICVHDFHDYLLLPLRK